MCRSFTVFAATSGVLLVANIAPAQDSARPQSRYILVPGGDNSAYGVQYTQSSRDARGRTTYRISPDWYNTVPRQSTSDYGQWRDRSRGYDPGDYYGHSHGHSHQDHAHHDHGGYRGPVRYRDARVQQVASWYNQLLGRALKPHEAQNWQNHLAQGRPEDQAALMSGILATILGSDEYFNRVGGRFDVWTSSVERATSRPISRAEAEDWSREYRRARDHQQVRIGLVRHLLEEHRPEPIVVPQYEYSHDRRFDNSYRDERTRYRDDFQLRERQRRRIERLFDRDD